MPHLHSRLGMRVVLETWRRHSNNKPKVNGLIFLDGSHYRLRKSLFAFDSGDVRSRTLSREERIAGMQEAFERMFSPRTPENFKETALQHVRQTNLDFSDAMRKSFVAFDFEEMDGVLAELGNSGTKVLNLQATDVDDENQRVPLEKEQWSRWMQFLQEKVPQAEQIVVTSSSHFPHIDQPSKVERRMRTFLMKEV